MKRAWLVSLLLVACGKPPVAPPEKPAPPAPSAPVKVVEAKPKASSACPSGRQIEDMDVAVPGVYACNILPPWTRYSPYLRCPESGCWRPCQALIRSRGDGKGQHVTYAYDDRGRIASAITKDTDGTTVLWTEKWEYPSKTESRHVHSTFGTYTFHFDDSGRLLTSESRSYAWTYERDGNGRVISQKGKSERNKFAFEFRYDESGRLVAMSMREPSQVDELTVKYDEQGRQAFSTLRSRHRYLHWEGDRIVGATNEPGGKDIEKVTYDAQGRPVAFKWDTGESDEFEYACQAK